MPSGLEPEDFLKIEDQVQEHMRNLDHPGCPKEVLKRHGDTRRKELLNARQIDFLDTLSVEYLEKYVAERRAALTAEEDKREVECLTKALQYVKNTLECTEDTQCLHCALNEAYEAEYHGMRVNY